jgi:hypothetical protein
LAAGDRFVEDAADFHGAELNLVAVGDVGGFGSHAGQAGEGLEDGEERGCRIRHFFASEVRLVWYGVGVKRNFRLCFAFLVGK